MQIAQRYIYPPRPKEGAVPNSELPNFEQMGWKGQLKFNGNRLEISGMPGDFTFYNRHRDVHKRYTPPEWLLEELTEVWEVLGLDENWSLLDGEILHNKHKLFSDTIVLWDILVRNGEWLLNTTYEERYDWIRSKIGDAEYVLRVHDEEFVLGIMITEHIFVPLFTEDLNSVWDLTQKVNNAAWIGSGEPVLEGVVLKRPNGKLEPGLREKNNTSWQQRCRIKTGRHQY